MVEVPEGQCGRSLSQAGETRHRKTMGGQQTLQDGPLRQRDVNEQKFGALWP